MTEPSSPSYARRLAGGALMSALGTLGKVLFPLHFIVATRLYGPSAVGIFLLLNVFLEMAKTTTVSGLADATMVYLSKRPDDRQYQAQILGSALWMALAISALIMLAGAVGGIELIADRYPNYPHIGPALYQLWWVIPFSLLPQIAIAATHAQLLMRWSTAINGFLYPSLLIGTAVGFYFVMPTVEGLVASLAVSVVLTGLASVVVLLKFYSTAELIAMVTRPRWHRPTLGFAIPQNLNMTFLVFTTNVDILMLGSFGVKEAEIAFYGIGAQIIRNLKQVRLSLTRAYAPLVVRLHAQGDRVGLNNSFSLISRWSMSIGFPIAFVVAALHEDVLRLFDESFTKDTTFMLVLLGTPLTSMAIGAAATILVMAGHTRLNLVNSLISAGLNIGLNTWLIPQYGLLGAAVATAVTTVVTATLINIEVAALERVHLLLHRIYRPLVAGVPAGVVLIAARVFGYVDLSDRLATAAACVIVFFGIYAVLGIDAEDREVWNRRNKRSDSDESPKPDTPPTINGPPKTSA